MVQSNAWLKRDHISYVWFIAGGQVFKKFTINDIIIWAITPLEIKWWMFLYLQYCHSRVIKLKVPCQAVFNKLFIELWFRNPQRLETVPTASKKNFFPTFCLQVTKTIIFKNLNSRINLTAFLVNSRKYHLRYPKLFRSSSSWLIRNCYHRDMSPL